MSETVILSPDEEKRLGDFNKDELEIVEINELGGLREIEISYPIMDDSNSKEIGKYLKLIKYGNKIWRKNGCDGVGVLYIINDKKTIDPLINNLKIKAQEAAVELSYLPPIFKKPEKYEITPKYLDNITNNFFKSVNVQTGLKYNHKGIYTPLGLLREIERIKKHEFEFIYESKKNKEGKKVIKRYLNLKKQIGKIHSEPIEIGRNTDDIRLEFDESKYGVGIMPLGNLGNTKKEIKVSYMERKEFRDLNVKIGEKIPLWSKSKTFTITGPEKKDKQFTDKEDGDSIEVKKIDTETKKGKTKYIYKKMIYGPKVKAPFKKNKDENYIKTEKKEYKGEYNHLIHPKTKNKHLKLINFECNEKEPYNIYWECVNKLKENIQPQIKIETNLIKIKKGIEYNVGDTVTIKLPYQKTRVKARIIKTEKHDKNREDDHIEIGNHKINYGTNYIRRITENREITGI